MDECKLNALAKINIGLDVTGRRSDGYHDVDMIMQTIRLSDAITIHKTSQKGIRLSTNLKFLPTDEGNLAYKAAALLMDAYDIADGVDITVEKHIPVAAGMAGGSTDGAAVLYGMNRIFDLNLSLEKLCEYGAKLGADVPFCLMRGTARATGTGVVLTPIPPMIKCPVLIAKPNISVSTKWVYQNLKLDDTVIHPDIDALVAAIGEADLKKVTAFMGNVLESVTIPEYPVIAQIKEHMIKHGALGAMMSGSGPTVFGLFADKMTAKKAMISLRGSHLAGRVCLSEVYNNRYTRP